MRLACQPHRFTRAAQERRRPALVRKRGLGRSVRGLRHVPACEQDDDNRYLKAPTIHRVGQRGFGVTYRRRLDGAIAEEKKKKKRKTPPRVPNGHGAHVTRTGRRVGAAAGTWEHGSAPKKGGFSLVQCPFIGHGASAAGTARRAPATSARAGPPPQREQTQRCASALHAQATSPSEGQGFARGSTAWHRRRAASRLSSARLSRMPRVSPTRRGAKARVGSARAAPPPTRKRAQWRTSALHAQATSPSEGQGWHVGAQPCTEGGRLLARAAPFHRAWTECHERGKARTRVGMAGAGAPPRESERNGAQARYTRNPPHQVRASVLHVGARPCTDGGRLLA